MKNGHLVKVSQAVFWLKERGITFTPAALYRLIYQGRIPYTQRHDHGGQGSVRPGGRILINLDDLKALFVQHPAEKK